MKKEIKERFENIESEITTIRTFLNNVNFGENKYKGYTEFAKELTDSELNAVIEENNKKLRNKKGGYVNNLDKVNNIIKKATQGGTDPSFILNKPTQINISKPKSEEFITISENPESNNFEDVKKCESCGCLNLIEFDECYYCGKLFDKPEEEFIDIEFPEDKKTQLDHLKEAHELVDSVLSDKPEIIGDYMHFRGEDYYKVNIEGWTDFKDYSSTMGGQWKNIKEIDITDDIAKLRPWVHPEDSDRNDFYQLYAVSKNGNCTLGNGNIAFLWHKDDITIATTSDLKKAGITE